MGRPGPTRPTQARRPWEAIEFEISNPVFEKLLGRPGPTRPTGRDEFTQDSVCDLKYTLTPLQQGVAANSTTYCTHTEQKRSGTISMKQSVLTKVGEYHAFYVMSA